MSKLYTTIKTIWRIWSACYQYVLLVDLIIRIVGVLWRKKHCSIGDCMAYLLRQSLLPDLITGFSYCFIPISLYSVRITYRSRYGCFVILLLSSFLNSPYFSVYSSSLVLTPCPFSIYSFLFPLFSLHQSFPHYKHSLSVPTILYLPSGI